MSRYHSEYQSGRRDSTRPKIYEPASPSYGNSRTRTFPTEGSRHHNSNGRQGYESFKIFDDSKGKHYYASSSQPEPSPQPQPEPRSRTRPRAPSPVLTYTYDDEEPDWIPIAPAAWNKYTTRATREELAKYFRGRGVDAKTVEQELNKEFEAHAPQHCARLSSPSPGPKAYEHANQAGKSSTRAPPPPRSHASNAPLPKRSGSRYHDEKRRERRRARSPSPAPRGKSTSRSGGVGADEYLVRILRDLGIDVDVDVEENKVRIKINDGNSFSKSKPRGRRL